MTAWMLWAIATTALLGAAAHVLEAVMRGRGRAGRWAWAGAMAGALALQAWAVLAVKAPPQPAREAAAAPQPALAGAVSAWWSGVAEKLPETLDRLDPYVGALWLVASALLLTGLIGGFWRLGRRARSWPVRRVAGHDVLVSERFGPALVGIVSPRIVLPRWLLERGDECVVLACLHEAEHRRARDAWLLAAAALTAALLPWNPALWWHLVRLRAAVELDCDERVVDRGASPAAYARILLSLGTGGEQLSVAVPGFVQPPSLLERRLTMLIQGTRSRGAVATASSLAAAIVLVVAACETPTPVLAPERPSLGVAPERTIVLPSFDDMRSHTNGVGTPLTYVEGVRLSDAEFRRILESLDPSTVSSIEVIKGPAAVELYGADAVGGVIRMDLKD